MKRFRLVKQNLVTAVIDGDGDAMMASFDDLRSRLSDYVIALAIADGEKCQVVCGVSKSLTSSVGSRDIIEQLGNHAPIRGGGKPAMARAGGTATKEQLETALASLQEWLATRLDP